MIFSTLFLRAAFVIKVIEGGIAVRACKVPVRRVCKGVDDAAVPAYVKVILLLVGESGVEFFDRITEIFLDHIVNAVQLEMPEVGEPAGLDVLQPGTRQDVSRRGCRGCGGRC